MSNDIVPRRKLQIVGKIVFAMDLFRVQTIQFIFGYHWYDNVQKLANQSKKVECNLEHCGMIDDYGRSQMMMDGYHCRWP